MFPGIANNGNDQSAIFTYRLLLGRQTSQHSYREELLQLCKPKNTSVDRPTVLAYIIPEHPLLQPGRGDEPLTKLMCHFRFYLINSSTSKFSVHRGLTDHQIQEPTEEQSKQLDM